MLSMYQIFTVTFCLCWVRVIASGNGQVDEGVGRVVSVTQHVHDSTNESLGLIRSHYDASFEETQCSALLFVGVGTSMSVRDYDKLSTRIAMGSSIVVVIMDHNEHSIQKTSPQEYANLLNAINRQKATLIPACVNGEQLLLAGGHSSSGEAAIKAIMLGLVDFGPNGWVGLDPYDVSPKTIGNKDFRMELPSINWGFAKTTCFVSTRKAAKAAYELSNENARVLYEINNKDKDCKITHCVFSDHGCGITPLSCSTSDENDWVLTSVARSIHVFVNAVTKQLSFDRVDFQIEDQTKVQIFVNDEQVE